MSAAVTLDGSPPATRLGPRDRLELLCDPGTVDVFRSAIRPRRPSARTNSGDGVVAASGSVAGRPVFAFAQDQGVAGGSVGEAHAETIASLLRLAGEAGAPVVGFVESAGARMQEGVSALGGYGRIFRENVALSGRVPQISVITGTSAGGGCYSPALTDFIVMTEDARMFLTGPRVVREVIGEDVDSGDLGGRRVHERNGVCHFVAGDDAEAVELVRRLLGYLPQNTSERPPLHAFSEAPADDPGMCVPFVARRSYDVRHVIARLADEGSMLEVSERWARNMVTVLARIGGRPVGFVANQPRHMGGLIDVSASEKGAGFVQTCNRFGLPLVTLVDTPGFMPGVKQESAGVIRHGAELVRAFSAARVPRLTVILRKAYGGAYIAMNSKALGAQMVYAWPRAEIGIMGAAQAVGVIHRRELAQAGDSAELRRRLANDYTEQHLAAEIAAREGLVDELVEPPDTRRRLRSAIRVLETGRPRS